MVIFQGFYQEVGMLEILYQDEYCVTVNKPAGMLVHRSWLDDAERYKFAKNAL